MRRATKFFEQAGDHLIAQGVELVGTIHGEVEHAVAALGDQVAMFGGHGKSLQAGTSREFDGD